MIRAEIVGYISLVRRFEVSHTLLISHAFRGKATPATHRTRKKLSNESINIRVTVGDR